MKHLMNLKLLVVATLIIPFMASCGDDDNNEGSSSNKGKRITKIIEESQGSICESLLTYDEKGRISEVKRVTNSANVTNGVYTKTYQYGETLIIQKEVVENDPENLYPRTHTYTLSGGLIVKDTEIRNGTPIYNHFEYNQDGYWINYITYYEMDEKPEYLYRGHYIRWTNGNLSRIEYLGADMLYDYSNTPWTQGMIYDLTPFTDPILYAEGYFGKTPKYLPSDFDNATYQYSMSDGLVTKITKSYTDPYNEKYSYTIVIKFIWE